MIEIIIVVVGLLLLLTAKSKVEQSIEEIKQEVGDDYNPDAVGDPSRAAGCIVAAAILTTIIVVAIIGSLAPAGLLLPK